ncbi:MAG: hypothetical protein PF487_09300 [Bacteroidales bacterium]|jgi:phenylacetate-CoA ligase|nr:hypothetical protein [Bacteroidales bacterium]
MKILIRNFIKPLLRIVPAFSNSWKYGKVYRDTISFLEHSSKWNKTQIERWQFNELKSLLVHCNETVPYYTNLFKKCGFDPEGFDSLEGLKKIPYLTKDIIRENLKELVSVKYKNKLKYVTTGGSTGSPMGLYWHKGFTEAREQAFLWYLWGIKGINEYDKFVVLRGAIPPGGRNYYYQRKNKLLISAYQLNKENIPKIIKLIEKFKPSVIQGYPSALSILAKWMENNSYSIPYKLKVVLTSSENLLEFQEKLLIKVFGAQVYDLYGNTERTALINRCADNVYHINSFYGLVELVNNGAEGEEIISTSFNNYAMPFIRYKTDDLVSVGNQNDCTCGSNMKTIKGIVGRNQDMIYTKNKSEVTLTALIFSQHFSAFSKIDKMQIEQNEIGKIIVKIKPFHDKQFQIEDEIEIINKMQKSCLGDIEIKIKYVDEIMLTNRGKYKFLIQNTSI